MFKNLSLKILFTLFSLLSFSQDPVKWSTSVKKINDITFQLNTKAEIKDNWRLYSQNLDDGGALPTEFIFEDESIAGDEPAMLLDAISAEFLSSHYCRRFDF